MSIAGNRSARALASVAQLEPRQRRGEQDVDVAAAGGRDVGDVPGAEALEQLAELGRLVVDVTAAWVKVEREHPAGG